MEIVSEGRLPASPYVVAGNHHSFLDPFLIGGVVDRKIRFLALDDLFGNHALVDVGLRLYDVIPVKRGAVPFGPLRTALAHLSDGGIVGVFPEGTRRWVYDPEQTRPGAAWLATRAGVPLVPVAVKGSERILGIDNRLRSGRVRVTVGSPLRAESTHRDAIDDLMRRWGGWVAERLEG